MNVIYIDSVFSLNAVMDYLLLLGTARLAGITLRRWRYLLGALLGGVYAVAVFLQGLGFLSAVPVKIVAGVLMAMIAYGGEIILFRLTLLFLLVSCALAGCVLALGVLAESHVPMAQGVFYTDISGKTLLLAATAAYFVLSLMFRAAASHGLKGEFLKAEICLDGKRIYLRTLADTGNSLRNPVSGEPVLVASADSVNRCFSKETSELLKTEQLKAPTELMEQLRRTAPQLRFYLLPYRAVGVSGGMLLSVRSDWVKIEGERYPGLLIALSPEAVGIDYQALWGGQWGKGRHYEHHRTSAASGDPAGVV